MPSLIQEETGAEAAGLGGKALPEVEKVSCPQRWWSESKSLRATSTE